MAQGTRPRIDNAQSGRESLAKLGMTEAELDIWYALANVASQMYQLPTLHPMEWHEACHSIHKLQSRLQARPGLRAGGWKGKKPDQPIIKSPQAKRESLAKLGMTEAELDVWYALADVVSQMYKLPTLHPMEAHETQHDCHKLELRLLARHGLRAAGWPRKTPPG
jgi:hypothetical protein